MFEQLKCTREGLSQDEGANRLQIFGPNKLEEKKVLLLNEYTDTLALNIPESILFYDSDTDQL